MNTDTGRIYRTAQEIEEARRRGEHIVPISEEAAGRIEDGYAALNREERRRRDRELRRSQKIKTSV